MMVQNVMNNIRNEINVFKVAKYEEYCSSAMAKELIDTFKSDKTAYFNYFKHL